jgi:ketosteroid isomerase-like protein
MSDKACAQVLACEQRRHDALLACDVPTLSNLLSQDLIYVHSTALRDSHTSYLAKLQSGSLSYLTLVFEDLQVYAQATSAIVTGRMQAQIVKEGQIKAVRSLFLTVWWLEHNDQGEPTWRLRAHQGTAWPT